MNLSTSHEPLALDRLQAIRDELHLRQEIADLTAVIQSEQLAANQIENEAAAIFQEGWGEPVDTRRRFDDDAMTSSNRSSQLYDRLDGRFLPAFADEADLARMRGIGQFVASAFPAAINISEALTNYTIGKGFSYTARARSAESETVAEEVQRVIDDFCRRNDFAGDLERELHARSREDGEFFLALIPEGWRTRAEVIQAAAVTEPISARRLERWLGERESASWSFGVHTHRKSPSQAIGYHVVFSPDGGDWAYYSANSVAIARRAGSGLMEHFKRTPRNAKRGVSEFYAVAKWLQHAEGLLENTAQGAQIQAAIAYIVQHARGLEKSQVATAVAGQAYRRVNEWTPNGSQTRNERRIEPGKVLHTPRGTSYTPAPMGGSNAPNFMIIEQALLRLAGVRWAMPEYMVSGDASNANYASALVAESPFVKAREADQVFYASCFRRILWKVLKIAHAGGYFSRDFAFDELAQQIAIDVTPPEVATRNKLEDAKAKEILLRNGIISQEVWARETGYAVD